MSEWTPKVGDKVMVGEYGPYEVEKVWTRTEEAYISTPVFGTTVLFAWLTPAPEPEPDAPTAPGALVRDGAGTLMTRDPAGDWVVLDGSGNWDRWKDIPRPITVVLADPAEVEQLRAEVEALRDANDVMKADALHAEARADELQRRIDRFMDAAKGVQNINYLRLILRGES